MTENEVCVRAWHAAKELEFPTFGVHEEPISEHRKAVTVTVVFRNEVYVCSTRCEKTYTVLQLYRHFGFSDAYKDVAMKRVSDARRKEGMLRFTLYLHALLTERGLGNCTVGKKLHYIPYWMRTPRYKITMPHTAANLLMEDLPGHALDYAMDVGNDALVSHIEAFIREGVDGPRILTAWVNLNDRPTH